VGWPDYQPGSSWRFQADAGYHDSRDKIGDVLTRPEKLEAG
jgi:hypothetical protein